MRPIKLNEQRAMAGLAAILTGIANIERELDQLEAQVRTLESQWDGSAREAFSTASREWNASVVALHKVGREATDVSTRSVTRIADFDRRRAGAWSR